MCACAEWGRGWRRGGAERKVCVSAGHIDQDQLCMGPVLERHTHHKQTGGVGGAKKKHRPAPFNRGPPTQTTHTRTHTLKCTLSHALRAPAVSHSSASHTGRPGAPQRILLSSTEKKKKWASNFCGLSFASYSFSPRPPVSSWRARSPSLSASPLLHLFPPLRISGNEVRDLIGSFVCVFVCLFDCSPPPLDIFQSNAC